MIYGSVCSGIESASVAWKPLGWLPAFFAEIEKFPCQVLAHHYATVPNHGDMTRFERWPDHAIDVLVGGTPCKSFSLAGLRNGLDDADGNLMLVYAAIARKYRPGWLVWENVTGVFSRDGGRDFASLLGLLAGRRIEVPANGWRTAGIVDGYKGAYGLAWRVLDAEYVRVDGFGRAVPQRRRRCFVVGYSGDWRRAAAVLLEREGLSGNPAPRRQARPDLAAEIATGAAGDVASTLDAAYATKWGLEDQHINNGAGLFVITDQTVRRLTPRECERLMAFPDDYTAIPWRGKSAPDVLRYRALGNAMACNVMRWIGRRIEQVEEAAHA